MWSVGCVVYAMTCVRPIDAVIVRGGGRYVLCHVCTGMRWMLYIVMVPINRDGSVVLRMP